MISYKIANIVVDEKFIDGVINAFDEVFNFCEHDFIVITGLRNKPLRLIKKVNRIKFVPEREILNYLTEQKYNAVFLHNLESFPRPLISRIPENIKVFWFSWGYDIYQRPVERPFVNIKLHGPRTERFLNNKPSYFSKLKKIAKILLGREISAKTYYQAMHRVDYFSGVLPYEYDLMCNNPEFRAKRTSFMYSSPAGWIFNEESCQVREGKDIFIGNSAAPTNNHLDLLDYLEKLDLTGRKIILPLSYGYTNNYVETVCKAYSKLLGEKFTPILGFLPLEEYNKLYNSCGYAIFGHERQNAMGNIFFSLNNGLKVFLSNTSMVYKYLKDYGFIVFSIQDDLCQEALESRLSKEQILNNFHLCQKRGCKEAYIKCIQDIYRCLEEK